MNTAQLDFDLGKLAGRFMNIEAFKCDEEGNEIPGSRRKVCDDFDNLITNGGMDWWSGYTFGASYDSPCHLLSVGSGSAAPQFTDENLQNPVARVGREALDWGYVVDGETRYAWTRRSFTFGAGVAAGNLSEMGTWCPVGQGGTGDNERVLFSRALITDANGNPTTITILADEFLTVTYELRMYRPNLAPVTGTVSIGGVVRDVVVSPIRLDTAFYSNERLYVSAIVYGCGIAGHSLPASGPPGSPTPENLEGAGLVMAQSWSAYSIGSYERTANFTFGIGGSQQAWSVPVPVIDVRSQLGFFQMTIDPPLNKNIDQTMTLAIKFAWGRYSP